MRVRSRWTRSTFGAVALAALLLPMLAPVAQAAAGVTLQRTSPTDDESLAHVGPDEPVAFQTAYLLHLDRAMPLRLLSRFDLVDSQGLTVKDHTATWRIDGQAAGTSTRTTAATTASLAQGDHTIEIDWALGQAATGTYKVSVTTREEITSSGGASGTAASDRHETAFSVQRDAPTSTTTTSTAPSSSSTSTSVSTTSTTATTTSTTTTSTTSTSTTSTSTSTSTSVTSTSTSTSTTSTSTSTSSTSSSTSSSASSTQSSTAASTTSASTTASTTSAPPPPPPGDTTPPPAVSDLAVGEATSSSLRLTWSPVSDPSGVRYDVYGSRTSGFAAEGSNLIASIAAGQETAFTHRNLPTGTEFHYRVRTVDGAGNLGQLSPQASGQTAERPDTSAPGTVVGLHATKRTASSVALEWGPASDDRGVVAYRVLRDGSLIAETPGTRFTDDGASRVAIRYSVRAVDAAGNVGPATSVDVPEFKGDTGPLHVTRVRITLRGDTATIDWSTDEPASGAVWLDDGLPRREVSSDVAFSVGFGGVATGQHTFHIRMETLDGREATRHGTFTMQPRQPGQSHSLSGPPDLVLEQAPGDVASNLRAVLGVDADEESLFLEDIRGDAKVDGLADQDGLVRSVQAFHVQGLLLVERVSNGRLALLDPVSQRVLPVAEPDAVVRATERQPDLLKLVVEIPSKTGWVLVSIPDPDATMPILGVQRSDGTILPPDAAWRDGGRVFFIDDPATTYVVLFDHAGHAPDVDAAGGKGVDGGPNVPWLAIGIGAVVLIVAAVLFVTRRRLAP